MDARAIIAVENLVKRYEGGSLAVKGISFKVKEGECFGFLGPNGAGKSTTLVPASFMPGWMQIVSNFNPISYAVNAIRVLMLSGFDWTIILPAFAVGGVLIAITMGAVVYEFRKVVG